MGRPKYLPTPDTADMALQLDDIEGLLQESVKPLRDQRTLLHFVRRVEVTVRQHITKSQNMAAEIDRLNQRAATTYGKSTTLSPLDAVKFLSDDQKAALFEGMQADAYAATLRARAEADKTAAEHRRTAQALRLQFLRLVEDPTVDPLARQRIAAALDHVDRDLASGVDMSPSAPAAHAGSTPPPDATGVPLVRQDPVASLDDLFGER